MLSIAIVNLKCEWTIRKNWSWFILFLESKDQMILLGQTDKCGTTSQKCATFWCQNISEGCSRCICRGRYHRHVLMSHWPIFVFVLTAPPVLGELCSCLTDPLFLYLQRPLCWERCRRASSSRKRATPSTCFARRPRHRNRRSRGTRTERSVSRRL